MRIRQIPEGLAAPSITYSFHQSLSFPFSPPSLLGQPEGGPRLAAGNYHPKQNLQLAPNFPQFPLPTVGSPTICDGKGWEENFVHYLGTLGNHPIHPGRAYCALAAISPFHTPVQSLTPSHLWACSLPPLAPFSSLGLGNLQTGIHFFSPTNPQVPRLHNESEEAT